MGLEKEKKEVQEKINEGGEQLNEGEIKSIAVAVKALIDQGEEKKKVSDELSGVTKQVGELKGELGKVKQGMFCSPDGKYCFYTPEELNAFMKEQREKLNSMESKIGEIVSQVKTLKPAPSTAPEGLQHLPKMTEELRKGMSEEENKARDAEVKKIEDYYGETDNDRWRRLRQDKINLDIIAGKPEMRRRFRDTMNDKELKDITLMACKDGKCKLFREGMEKEEGIRFYIKDKYGKFRPVDEKEREGPHI